ncbi:hypothetical protein RCH19_000735 [Flavobacterium sp. PL12]
MRTIPIINIDVATEKPEAEGIEKFNQTDEK